MFHYEMYEVYLKYALSRIVRISVLSVLENDSAAMYRYVLHLTWGLAIIFYDMTSGNLGAGQQRVDASI